jgi:hypothetical protein
LLTKPLNKPEKTLKPSKLPSMPEQWPKEEANLSLSSAMFGPQDPLEFLSSNSPLKQLKALRVSLQHCSEKHSLLTLRNINLT